MRVVLLLLMALCSMGWCGEEKGAGRVEFTYWRCVSGEIGDEEADLILVVEVTDIRRIRDPLLHHFDFGVAAKVVERKKGTYEKPVMGIHVPRRVPLEEYDPKRHVFAKGNRYTIKAKIDKEGRVTIHDPRVLRR